MAMPLQLQLPTTHPRTLCVGPLTQEGRGKSVTRALAVLCAFCLTRESVMD